MHDEYIKATELLAIELGREPTSEEIDSKIADVEAKRIGNAYERIMFNRREAKRKMDVPQRILKWQSSQNK